MEGSRCATLHEELSWYVWRHRGKPKNLIITILSPGQDLNQPSTIKWTVRDKIANLCTALPCILHMIGQLCAISCHSRPHWHVWLGEVPKRVWQPTKPLAPELTTQYNVHQTICQRGLHSHTHSHLFSFCRCLQG
jgi:hypothetical protein